MKTAIMVVLLIISTTTLSAPVGSRFSYQGQLQFNDISVTGAYDFKIELWTQLTGGGFFGPALEIADVEVTDGIFTLELDFTESPFTGDDLFLKIQVREGASTGNYITMSPRQRINATPYAIQADFLAANGATTGQVLKFNGNDWAPGSDLSSPWQQDANGYGYPGHIGVDGASSPAFSLSIGSPTGTHPLIASVNGITALQVADNGGVRIGNGLVTVFPPPTSGLVVGGETKLSSKTTINDELIVQRDAKHSRTDSYGFVKAGIEFSCGFSGTTRKKYFNNINTDEITVQNGPLFGTCTISLPFAYGDLYLQTTIETNIGVVIAGSCDKTLSGTGGSELIVCRLYDVENNTSNVVASRMTLLMF